MNDGTITGVDMNAGYGSGVKGIGSADVGVMAGLGFKRGTISANVFGFGSVGKLGQSINATVTGTVSFDVRIGKGITGVSTSATVTLDTRTGVLAYGGFLSAGAEVVTSSDQLNLNLGLGLVNLSVHTTYATPSWRRGEMGSEWTYPSAHPSARSVMRTRARS
jgi:hypothetical protein